MDNTPIEPGRVESSVVAAIYHTHLEYFCHSSQLYWAPECPNSQHDLLCIVDVVNALHSFLDVISSYRSQNFLLSMLFDDRSQIIAQLVVHILISEEASQYLIGDQNLGNLDLLGALPLPVIVVVPVSEIILVGLGLVPELRI